ncbi:MAG: malate dehydrogenase [Candidatus Omnitrophota bacterium]
MKISIIGGGNVGATLANRIVGSDLADVVLIDVYKGMAQGKALDLLHAAPLMGYQRKITGTDDYGMIENSNIVVITAGFPRQPGMTRSDLISKNSAIIRDVILNVKRKCHRAIIIVVTNPLDVMTFLAHKESGLRRERIFGMAGVLDSSRFAYIIARELKVAYKDVETIILGQHGPEMVPLVSHTKVAGQPLRRLLPKEKIDELIKESRGSGAHIVGLLGKGSAYYAPSAAIFTMIKAIVKDEKRLMPVSCFTMGEYGISDVCTGLPVKLGKDGLEEVVLLKLDPEEEESLRRSAESTRELISHL